jgi:hypothetical protein
MTPADYELFLGLFIGAVSAMAFVMGFTMRILS